MSDYTRWIGITIFLISQKYIGGNGQEIPHHRQMRQQDYGGNFGSSSSSSYYQTDYNQISRNVCKGRTGYVADVSRNCQVFYNCLPDGTITTSTCPGNYQFDERSQCCKMPHDVNCEGLLDPGQNSRPTIQCSGKRGFFADIRSGCKIFYFCEPSGRSRQLSCPDGLLFNDMIGCCDIAQNVRCGTLSNPATRPPVPVDATDSFCRNRGSGFFSNPTECSSYYYCQNNGRGNLLRCPSGQAFNEQSSSCDSDTSRCYGIQVEPSVFDCTGRNGWYSGNDPGCRFAFYCNAGIAYQHNCPGRLRWSSYTLSCDVPEKVQCNGRNPGGGNSGSYEETSTESYSPVPTTPFVPSYTAQLRPYTGPGNSQQNIYTTSTMEYYPTDQTPDFNSRNQYDYTTSPPDAFPGTYPSYIPAPGPVVTESIDQQGGIDNQQINSNYQNLNGFQGGTYQQPGGNGESYQSINGGRYQQNGGTTESYQNEFGFEVNSGDNHSNGGVTGDIYQTDYGVANGGGNQENGGSTTENYRVDYGLQSGVNSGNYQQGGINSGSYQQSGQYQQNANQIGTNGYGQTFYGTTGQKIQQGQQQGGYQYQSQTGLSSGYQYQAINGYYNGNSYQQQGNGNGYQQQGGGGGYQQQSGGGGYQQQNSGSSYQQQGGGGDYQQQNSGGGNQQQVSGGDYQQQNGGSGYQQQNTGNNYQQQNPHPGYSHQTPGVCLGRTGLFADRVYNCKRYYVCDAGGNGEVRFCPGSMIFNEAIGDCDDQRNVNCFANTPGIVQPSVPVCESGNTANKLVPDTNQGCMTFYSCEQNGRGAGFRCPNGLQFNIKINACDDPRNCDCAPTNGGTINIRIPVKTTNIIPDYGNNYHYQEYNIPADQNMDIDIRVRRPPIVSNKMLLPLIPGYDESMYGDASGTHARLPTFYADDDNLSNVTSMTLALLFSPNNSFHNDSTENIFDGVSTLTPVWNNSFPTKSLRIFEPRNSSLENLGNSFKRNDYFKLNRSNSSRSLEKIFQLPDFWKNPVTLEKTKE